MTSQNDALTCNRTDVLGLPLLDASPAAVAAEICSKLDSLDKATIHCMNPHSFAMFESDAAFRGAINQATALVCDGVGMSLAALLTNGKKVSRITGSQLFTAVSAAVSQGRPGSRVMFIGGDPAFGTILKDKYQAEFAGFAEVHVISPRVSADLPAAEINGLCAEIDSFQPDLLWVCLGSPKQEKVLALLARSARFKVGFSVGAVVDFYTGRIKRAPRVFQKAGLEWLHRLATEPRRLAPRTFKSGPIFARSVFAEIFKPK